MTLSSRVGVAFGLFFLAITAQAEDWKLIKEQNGVKLYSSNAPVDHPDASTYRGVVTLKASLSKVRELQADTTVCILFSSAGCPEQKLLKQEGSHIWISSEIKLVHPLWPRDAVVRVTTIDSGCGIVRFLEATPTFTPKNETHLVRIDYFDGYWKFLQKEPDQVEVTYEASLWLNGNLPPVAAKSALESSWIETLSSLKKRAEE